MLTTLPGSSLKELRRTIPRRNVKFFKVKSCQFLIVRVEVYWKPRTISRAFNRE